MSTGTGPGLLKVVVVDDHDLVREGLRGMLDAQDGIDVVGTAGHVDEALSVVRSSAPDVVLLDLRLGAVSGTEVARRLRADGSTVTILVLSAHDRTSDLEEALRAGADGYLLKSTDVGALVDGVRRAHAGETVIAHDFVPSLLEHLAEDDVAVTPREGQVLDGLARSLSDRAIATELGISVRTAQKHVENLFRKFGVHDRQELVRRARRNAPET